MNGSVRARLTAGVTTLVGLLAVAVAVAAPAAVRHALVADRLDGEVVKETGAMNPLDIPDAAVDRVDMGRLTETFAPSVQRAAEVLDGAAALERLRALHPDRDVVVMIVPRLFARIDDDRAVTFERRPDAETVEPVVTLTRLDRLVTTFLPQESYEPIVDLLDDGGSADPTRTAQRPIGDDLVYGIRRIDGHDLIVTASADGIEGNLDRVRTGLWLAVPAAMLTTALVTWLLAGRALRPVRAITATTSRIRSSTLHERVPVPRSRDEIAGLATEMNTMLDRVQQEDTRRRQFVADASHELRSPIAAIRTQAEVAIATADSPETHELAGGVLAEAERLGGIVDDLLALARHDEGSRPPGVPVDLDEIVLAEANRPRRVPIDIRGVSAGRVLGRVDELTRMVTHLLDNAARHAATTVRVSVQATADAVVFAVDDDGPGIPPDERERVFERFVRLDEARQRDRGGAGLGLAVVRAAAETGGGTVVAAESDLGGARFEVRLPSPRD